MSVTLGFMHFTYGSKWYITRLENNKLPHSIFIRACINFKV